MNDHVKFHRVLDTPGLILSEGHYSDNHMDPHFHIDYHIGLVDEGVQRQKFKGQTVLLGPGRVSVMPPGEIHDGAAGADKYRMKTFRISSALLTGYFEDVFDKPNGICFGGAMVENEHIASRLLRIYSDIQQESNLSSLAVEESWLGVLTPLLSTLCAVSPKSVVGGLSQRHWMIVKDYCYANFAGKIVLDDLGKLCGLSRYQFLRRFEKTTGVTPRLWLIQLRLEHACAMLRNDNMNIANVAVAVGFYDHSHFNRAFRQAYGVSPSLY